MREEIKSKSRQPWEFERAGADRVWDGLVDVVWVARAVGSCRNRRDGRLTFVYIWVARSLLATTATVNQSRRYWPAAPLLLNPQAPELKELSHIISCVHLHGTRSYDLVLDS